MKHLDLTTPEERAYHSYLGFKINNPQRMEDVFERGCFNCGMHGFLTGMDGEPMKCIRGCEKFVSAQEAVEDKWFEVDEKDKEAYKASKLCISMRSSSMMRKMRPRKMRSRKMRLRGPAYERVTPEMRDIVRLARRQRRRRREYAGGGYPEIA